MSEQDPNAYPKKGWSCARLREMVMRNIQESPGITAVQIAHAEKCPLWAVERTIKFLALRGMIKPRV